MCQHICCTGRLNLFTQNSCSPLLMEKRLVVWDLKQGLWVLSNRPLRLSQWMMLTNISGFLKTKYLLVWASWKKKWDFYWKEFSMCNFKRFCCVLFKSNNQTPSSFKRELHCCDCAPLRPDWQCYLMMFRKSILKTTQLQSYLCLGSPSQLLLKDLQTIILIAADESQSMFSTSP